MDSTSSRDRYARSELNAATGQDAFPCRTYQPQEPLLKVLGFISNTMSPIFEAIIGACSRKDCRDIRDAAAKKEGENIWENTRSNEPTVTAQ